MRKSRTSIKEAVEEELVGEINLKLKKDKQKKKNMKLLLAHADDKTILLEIVAK